jgi:hypothetical protein
VMVSCDHLQVITRSLIAGIFSFNGILRNPMKTHSRTKSHCTVRNDSGIVSPLSAASSEDQSCPV